jgi:hypothetical protein
MANINDFKAQMRGGGARPNQYRIILSFPAGLSISSGAYVAAKASFLCNATSLPASNVANVPVGYRGRTVNFAGERSFQPWNINVYTDVDFDVRNAMEEWQSKIQNYAATNGETDPVMYQSDMVVEQLDRNGAVLKYYVFKDAYPINIGEIQLSYNTDNQIETFGVTFQYNYFTSSSTDQDNASSTL